VVLTLPVARRTLRVRSTPAGANLFVDGVLVPATTPCEAEFSPDSAHELRIERAGFITAVSTIAPGSSTTEIAVQLSEATERRATIFVRSPLMGALVIDGVEREPVVPSGPIELEAGRHLVEVVSGPRRLGLRVELDPGETRRLLVEGAVAPAPATAPSSPPQSATDTLAPPDRPKGSSQKSHPIRPPRATAKPLRSASPAKSTGGAVHPSKPSRGTSSRR
jgi:hypothetical protein